MAAVLIVFSTNSEKRLSGPISSYLFQCCSVNGYPLVVASCFFSPLEYFQLDATCATTISVRIFSYLRVLKSKKIYVACTHFRRRNENVQHFLRNVL